MLLFLAKVPFPLIQAFIDECANSFNVCTVTKEHKRVWRLLNERWSNKKKGTLLSVIAAIYVTVLIVHLINPKCQEYLKKTQTFVWWKWCLKWKIESHELNSLKLNENDFS